MGRIVWTEPALGDVREIVEFIAKDSLELERPAGDADLAQDLELPPDLGAALETGQDPRVALDQRLGLLAGFPEELDAEAAHPARDEPRDVRGRRLRVGVEERIAATDVGQQRMGFAHMVSERNAMPVARPAAIVKILAIRE